MKNEYEITPTISYALNLKERELVNVPYFFDSRITQHLFRSLSQAKLKSVPLRLNEIYIDAGASEVGIRKRIAQCIRRLPFLSNKAKIETSVPIGVRDEEVEVHRKSDCGHLGRG